MKFDSKLFLKWITIEKSDKSEAEFQCVNLCVLTARNFQDKVVGFTAFENKSLDQKFFDRFNKRLKTLEFQNLKFILYVPQHLKFFLDSLQLPNEIKNTDIVFTSFVHIKRNPNRFVLRDKLRVVNVDDSASLLKFLKHSMEGLGFIDVVAQVSDPKLAVETIERLNPDIVTMDIQMPNMTGVDVVRKLLNRNYYRIIMISSLTLEEGSLVFEALNAGACDYLQKPKFEEKDLFDIELKGKLLAALDHQNLRTKEVIKRLVLNTNKQIPDNLIWCFGASTGGTKALTDIFTGFPNGIPPTLIVQHIPPVFSKAFAESLNKLCPFTVKEAEHGEPLLPNHVYVAPGGLQMKIRKDLSRYLIQLEDSEPVNRFKPSVDFLFHELAALSGLKFVAGLLTGMGKDGAEGLLVLKRQGAFTVAQDEATSAVYGMPRHAAEIGAVDKVAALGDIAQIFLERSYHSID